MSSRASRSKAAAAAPAAAAPKAAPAKARATRRKRGDDEGNADAAADAAATPTAAEDDAPAASSKRARRGRGGADEAESARSPSPALSKAAADDDEDGSAAMSDAPRASPLDSLRVSSVGHMFSAADPSGRPSLPLIVSHLTLDYLSAADIVSNVAATAQGWYATAAEYAKLVAHNAARATGAAAGLAIGAPAPRQPLAERKKAAAEARAAAAASASSSSSASAASFPASSMIGMRSEITNFTSIRCITLLLSSRLRALVSGIHTRSVGATNNQNRNYHRTQATEGALFALEARLVGRIAETIPTLTSLSCQLSSSSVHPEFDFPANLRELHVSLMAKVAPHLSPLEKKARTTKPPKSWDEAQCDQYAIWVLSKAAALKKLEKLQVSTCASPHSRGWGMGQTTATPKPSWIQPLTGCASLRELVCEVAPFRYQNTPGLWAPAFRALTQLEVLRGRTVPPLKELLKEPHGFKSLRIVPLHDVTISSETLPLLQSLSGTLTDLNPMSWGLMDIPLFARLADFTALRSLGFGVPENQPAYMPQFNPGVGMETIVDAIEGMSLARRTQIESLRLQHAEGCSNELLERLLRALPGLRKLVLASKTVTFLSAFSSVPSLAASLTYLDLKLPALPRDEVSHLLSLSQLEELSIASSFTEPLYAKQLFPFQPPYPKSPLHWLRRFTPRSPNEPVPTPPVDLVARAAAYADFDARVRAGEVRPAELLNSAQLSGAFEFLSVADFSFAGRACRAWRAAAALPSAWGISNNKPDVANDASVSPPLGSGLWSSSRDWVPQPVSEALMYGNQPVHPVVSGRGRELTLRARQPECRPNIITNLPLWRNARAVKLLPYERYVGVDLGQATVEFQEQPLKALGLLPRLEQLHTKFAPFQRSDLVVRALEQCGSHLRRLLTDEIPTAAYKSLTRLEELELTGGGATKIRGPELLPLHRLRKLSVVDAPHWGGDVRTGGLGAELGLAVRALSGDHALREFNLVTSMPTVELFEAMAGGATGPAAAPSGVAPMEEEKVCGLDEEEAAPASAVTAPALLDRLRVVWRCTALFPFRSVFRLPQLHHLEVTTLPGCQLVDLTLLERMANEGAAMPPLESLMLCGVVVLSGLHNIELLPKLRDLRFSDCADHGGYHNYGYGQPTVSPDNAALGTPRWGQKLMHLRKLEALALDGVQIHPEDLAPLDQLPNLRALSLNGQQKLQASHLAVLPRIRCLTELQLGGNPLLPLLQRDWMKEIGRPENSPAEEADEADADGMADAPPADAAAAAGAAADFPAAAAAAPSSPSASGSKPAAVVTSETPGVLPLLLQCRSLQVLRWQTHAKLLAENTAYTTQRTWVKAHKSSALDQARTSKEEARDRQALRSIKEANPTLRVSWHSQYFNKWVQLELPPPAGSEEEEQANERIASREKEQSKADKQRHHRFKRVLQAPPEQAIIDRDTLEMEIKEEVYWKADAERMAAKKKGGKKKTKY